MGVSHTAGGSKTFALGSGSLRGALGDGVGAWAWAGAASGAARWEDGDLGAGRRTGCSSAIISKPIIFSAEIRRNGIRILISWGCRCSLPYSNPTPQKISNISDINKLLRQRTGKHYVPL
jgi:hypothetical protein